MHTRGEADTHIILIVLKAALDDYPHVMGCTLDADIELAPPLFFDE